MGWTPTPRYYPSRDAWFVQLDGKKIRLAAGKGARDEAFRAYHRLMLAGKQVAPEELPFQVLAHHFLDHVKRECRASTYEFYQYKLDSARQEFGRVKAVALKPSHISRWLDRHDWGMATRRGAIKAVKACLSFGVREGLISAHPLAYLEAPPMPRYERTLDPAERAACFEGATDEAFRDFLLAMQETGARPSEIMGLEARHIDWREGLATFPGKTTGATGKLRAILLTQPMLELCRRLAERWPEGPLFRNRDGKPWNRSAIVSRFRRLRERAGKLEGVSAKTFRHSFVTDGLERGVPIAMVSELVGHSDTQMVGRVYSHLSGRKEALRQAAERALGRSGETPSPSPSASPSPSPRNAGSPSPATGRAPDRS